MLFIPLLLYLSATVSAQCGSLVTYRQHSDLLQTAPQCLRDGCSQTQTNGTISSSCPSTSPCSTYWNMFVEQFDQSHNWCSACNSDIACRIPGWPIMNATKLCQTTPNQLLFGAEGCCIENDEPFQLAAWTGKLCNGTEWRQQFDICGGMACLDWQEWILPWNWTVQNNTLPPDQQTCTAPSKYLAIYALEQFFWLLTTFGVGWVRLKIAQHEEAKNRSVLRYFLLTLWTGRLFKQDQEKVFREKQLPEGEHLRPPLTDRLRWGFPVIMGAFLAGVQLGFNFLAAYIVKSAPGYEDIPLAPLALLFCCRPRLSWLSCLLALVPKERLVKIFKFKEDGDGLWAAKLVLSSVAVTSAVTEAIMQLLGAYFLGSTVHVGAVKGFYLIHHLRPKMWGRDARRMYIGALCWIMLSIPLVVVWFFVALFFSTVYDAVAGWRRGIFHFLNPKKNKVPELVQGPVEWLLDYINPDPLPMRVSHDVGQPNPSEQPMAYNPDQPLPVAPDNPFDQPTPYGGPAASELFEDQPLRVRSNSGRSRYYQITESEFTDQPLMVPRATASGNYNAVSGGYSNSATGIQRRTPSGGQYNSLSQNDDHDAIETDDQPLRASDILPPSPLRREIGNDNQNGSHVSLLAPQTDPAPPGSSGNTSSNKRSDFTDSVTLKWQHWESKVIFAGAFLGILAYASQWVFWDGFVKAAGDRFCPPSLLEVGGLWWGGAFLYVGAPFLGY